MRVIVCRAIGLFLPCIVAGCHTITAVTVDKSAIFLVEPEVRLQTIEDVSGGNFVHKFSGIMDPIDRVGEYNLSHLQPAHARVRIAVEDWEPTNDNHSSDVIDPNGFEDAGYNRATFQLMQKLQARGARITAAVWDIPAWMTSDPAAKRGKAVRYELHSELAESIIAWLLHARDRYGVQVDYISLNEPDIGVYVGLSPSEYSMIVRASAPLLEKFDLTTKWLIGDVSRIGGRVPFLETIWSNEDLRPYLGPIAVHSWDSDAVDDAYLGLQQFAAKTGLDIWVTEAGWAASAWRDPSGFASWNNALGLAAVYNRLIKMTGATVFLYWQMLGTDYYLNDGHRPFPAFAVLRQLNEQVPRGSTIVRTSANTADILLFAADAPSHFMVHLVNRGEAASVVVLKGLPDSTYSLIQSTAAVINQREANVDATGNVATFELPASSVSLLTTRKIQND